jgi:malonate-semialdehyde dehydrogenase (acetylating) / methylmalonate-semialdehyde dehydrogenase
MVSNQLLKNYINGKWINSTSGKSLDVLNPAENKTLSKVPLSTISELNQVVEAANNALPRWRRTPVTKRIQYLFELKRKLEENYEDIARTITLECGKTIHESRGELNRAIENVEVACGAPILSQGYNSEDIASGIDEILIKQPVGVCAIIAPFNFPAMISFWFLPYALACGNTCIIKPSERVPNTMQKLFKIIEELDLPPGVINMINGDRVVSEGILDHPGIDTISFVGSTAVARYVYERAGATGKRVQASGGAKNPIIILPDADPEMTTKIVADSAFGCAGQRCLAASLAITVGDAKHTFLETLSNTALNSNVGFGLNETVQMGPVISSQSKQRIESLIQDGINEGAGILVDGRNPSIQGYESGNFIRPTILDNIKPGSKISQTEIFGPVLGMMHVNTIDDAIHIVNSGKYGNMACLFTSSGASARKFKYEAEAGNIGINIGVAAPMAFFPFSGWKDSFFGDLHGQGRDAFQFFTRSKVVVERWPETWSRQF